MMSAIDLVLASGSPRRRELLAYFGVPFRIVATDAEEQETAPSEIVAQLPPAALRTHDHPTLRAWRKAHAVCAQVEAGVVIAADTIVVLNGEVLNKPNDAAHACGMLRQLSGREHTVFTGLTLIDTRTRQTPPRFALVQSRVGITALSDTDIASYVATGEPLDKAGGYGIQGLGGRLVSSVIGSYTNVVGLPIAMVQQLFAQAGIPPNDTPEALYLRWLRDQGKEPLPCPPTSP